MYRLTDPIIRENYLLYGDVLQQPTISCALPKKAIEDKVWPNLLLFGYITLFALGVPGCIGLWWIQSQKTTEGLHASTAQKFFAAATHRKNLDFADIITLLSECQEIVSAVRLHPKQIEKLAQLYLTLPHKREIDSAENISVNLLPTISDSSLLKLLRCYYTLTSTDMNIPCLVRISKYSKTTSFQSIPSLLTDSSTFLRAPSATRQ